MVGEQITRRESSGGLHVMAIGKTMKAVRQEEPHSLQDGEEILGKTALMTREE
jgi:hypothetical protein